MIISGCLFHQRWNVYSNSIRLTEKLHFILHDPVSIRLKCAVLTIKFLNKYAANKHDFNVCSFVCIPAVFWNWSLDNDKFVLPVTHAMYIYVQNSLTWKNSWIELYVKTCCHKAIFSKSLAWVFFAAFLCTEMAHKIWKISVNVFMRGNWFEVLASFRLFFWLFWTRFTL